MCGNLFLYRVRQSFEVLFCWFFSDSIKRCIELRSPPPSHTPTLLLPLHIYISVPYSILGCKLGLGTSTPQEAKQYFSHMENHQIPFTYSSEQDFNDIIMAFSKKHVEARKEWLQNFVPGTYLDHDADAICYSDFINKELILFSMADNVRSIPSIMDGLKPGQRKVRRFVGWEREGRQGRQKKKRRRT